MKKIIKSVLLCMALGTMAGAIIIYPERYVQSCLQGFVLWAQCVLPSLFPFMVITMIFIKTGLADKAALPLKKVTGFFGLPPAAAVCFVMSICSGYPAGSRAVYEFYEGGSVSKRDAGKLAALCSTSGPLFIIGSVGVGMFGDKGAGWKILIAHALSVIVIALIISLLSKREKPQPALKRQTGGNVLYDSFYGSVVSVLVAGGFIAFFCVAARVASDFYILYPIEKFLSLFLDGVTAEAASRGLVEVTSGCRALPAAGKFTVPLAGFLITFGGVSILMQQLCYLLKAHIKPVKFVFIKFLQGAACFLILLLIQ